MKQDLEKDDVYQAALIIAAYCYSVIDELPDDEKYPTKYILSTGSSELATSIAEALGSDDPRDRVWKYGISKRAAYSLYSVLQQLHKRSLNAVDPTIMLKLQTVADSLAERIDQSKTNIATDVGIFDAETYRMNKKPLL